MLAATIVFDLDGTLVDTAPDLVDALNETFRREGLTPLSFEEARAQISGGMRAFIERGLALEGWVGAPAEVERLYASLLDHYADHIADKSRPFPGLESALDRLAADGCRLAVCTNKLEALSVRLLETLGLSGRFVAICGADTFGIAKPDPEVLRRTIVQAGGEIGRAILVGDSATDVATARNAGIPVVGVDFGYTDTPMAELAPDRLIGHFDRLPVAVSEILAPARQASADGNER